MAHAVETMAYAHTSKVKKAKKKAVKAVEGEVIEETVVEEVAQEAYQTPWHGLGKPVSNDLTPMQMMQAAELDWTVDRYPSYIKIADENGEVQEVSAGKDVLVRSSDKKILTHISEGWEPVQNETAFNFFNDFVAAGKMEMNTAGSLRGGKMVWALAKIGESFDAVKNDKIDSYLLFSNPHEYGTCVDVRFTAIRVVCNNTLTLALNTKADQMIRVNHSRKFDPEMVKSALGLSHQNMENYKEMAHFIARKKFKMEDLIEYYKTVFPLTGKGAKDGEDKLSRAAQLCLDNLDTQPGAKYGKGSWWQAFNSATFSIDHQLGHSQETRLASSWYGPNRQRKILALEKAVEYANT